MEVTNALTVTPHPLTLDGQKHIAAELVIGETLGEFLRRHVDNLDSGAWIVTIDGHEVAPAMWNKTRPKHGTMIECRCVVRKQVLALVAVVVLSYFTMGLGGMSAAGGGSFLGLTGAAGWST